MTFIDEEDLAQPWKRPAPRTGPIPGPLPKTVSVTLANGVCFAKAELPQPLANRLIRLAAFQNPELYRAQAMRRSVWDKPRVIGRAEGFPMHLALPRGCLDAATALLRDNGIGCELHDERSDGDPIAVTFAGRLRADQEAAVTAMLAQDTGVLCAPTAFGKTVVAAAMIARRGLSTLVLVQRTDLLKQWQGRLGSFLDLGNGMPGTIGGGRTRPSGQIDIGVMQTLARSTEVASVVGDYGQVIVDECHHMAARSFESILKAVRARYVLGLTATPIRRDGLEPIIFMQCGPLRYTAGRPAGAPHDLAVVPRELTAPIALPPESGIQEVFRYLASDQARTSAICEAIRDALGQGRKVLVLTERTGHLEAIRQRLGDTVPNPSVLHGRMSRRQRSEVVQALDALPPDAPRLVIATGRLVGEGFDHPPLDTLVLAMPVSWKGTLHQYAGRLHRDHATKADVRIIDFVDRGHPALLRMWARRQRGYRTIGYRIVGQPELPL